MDDTSFIEAINHAQGLGREAARPVYEELWESATRAHDQYHCCIVAHFMAHAQVEAEAQRAWHLRALHAADAAHDERVTSFYPSLYGNLADTYLRLGDLAQAQHYIEKARATASILQDDGYGRMIHRLIARVTQAVTPRDDGSHS
ncbi:MAG: tetratricopeptide repeat protein [Ktedonobacterales bacterium]